MNQTIFQSTFRSALLQLLAYTGGTEFIKNFPNTNVRQTTIFPFTGDFAKQIHVLSEMQKY